VPSEELIAVPWMVSDWQVGDQGRQKPGISCICACGRSVRARGHDRERAPTDGDGKARRCLGLVRARAGARAGSWPWRSRVVRRRRAVLMWLVEPVSKAEIGKVLGIAQR
jgi:hypothetical protein